MIHRATPDFWYFYRQLPTQIQDLADKCYDLLKQDPYYPSLHFKKVGRFWTIRVGLDIIAMLGYKSVIPTYKRIWGQYF